MNNDITLTNLNINSFSKININQNTKSLSNTFNVCVHKNTHWFSNEYECQPINCNDRSHYYYKRMIYRDKTIKREKPVIVGSHEGSMCAISTKYKFAYLHNLKAGGSSIKEHLKGCICDNNGEWCDDIRLKTCNKKIFNDDSYFIFTFVRNPYSRMVSNYFFKKAHPTDLWKNISKMPVSFKEFANDIHSLDKYSTTHESHLNLQSDFILSSTYCPGVDYIAKLENFDQEFVSILNTIYNKSNYVFPLKKCLKEFNTNVNFWGKYSLEKYGKKSWEDMYDDEIIQKAVYTRYQNDFQYFGYLYNL